MTVPRPRPFGLLGEGAVDVGEAVSFRVSTNGPGLARPVLVSQDGPPACGHHLCCQGGQSQMRLIPRCQVWGVGLGGFPDPVRVCLGRSQDGTAVWSRIPVCVGT